MGRRLGWTEFDPEDAFEASVERALGESIRADPKIAQDLWCALANAQWTHRDGNTASYSFRAAGDLVAAMPGEGDYLDWYRGGDFPVVSRRFENALKAEGWSPKIDE